MHTVTVWRHARKAKALALGVNIEDLPDMREVASNRSCHYSEKHHNYLYSAAWHIMRQFKDCNLDVDELVNVGWYGCARYHEDIVGEYKRILIKMYVFAMSRYKGVDFYSENVPIFVNDADELMEKIPFRINEHLSINDDTGERVSTIFGLCSPDEIELLRLRFYLGMTYKEIGEIYNRSFSNMITKYKRLFERIRKRLCGEKTRGLRTVLNG